MAAVCGGGDDGALNFACGWFLRLTNNDLVAALAGTVVPALLKILLILGIAYVLFRISKRLIKRFTRQMAGEGVQRLGRLRDRAPLSDTSPMDLSRAAMRTETVGGVLGSIATFVIWGFAAVIILGSLGVELGPLVAGAGIAGVALGFGAQSVVRDFLAGLFVIMEDQYGIGDVVEFRSSVAPGSVSGTVEAISLRATRIRDIEGTVWHVPNGEVRTAGNKSQQWARSLIDVSVAYGTDVDYASSVIKRTCDELWNDEEFGVYILEEPELWGVERFDADGVAIRLVIKVQPAKQWVVNRELRRRIKMAFDAEGIEIPFPQRTVWLRTEPEAEKTSGPATS